MRHAGVMALALVMLTGPAAYGQRRGLPSFGDEHYIRTPHRYQLFLDGGLSIPTGPGDFSHSWATTLPIQLGAGVTIFPWLDVNAVYSRSHFGSITLDAKRKIDFIGVDQTTGGDISTTRFYSSVRFLAVPQQQLNPLVEIGVGYFKTTANKLTVSGNPPNLGAKVTFVNQMNDESGLAITFGVGAQYALNTDWSTYAKFMWNINSASGFAPSNLLLHHNEAPGSGDGNQQFANIVVGLMIRI